MTLALARVRVLMAPIRLADVHVVEPATAVVHLGLGAHAVAAAAVALWAHGVSFLDDDNSGGGSSSSGRGVLLLLGVVLVVAALTASGTLLAVVL